MKLKPRRRAAKPTAPQQQAAPPAAPPAAPSREYAALGADAPIAWPAAGQRRVPVTGELSPHAVAALKRMGITKD
jgi:hypothetical protein